MDQNTILRFKQLHRGKGKAKRSSDKPIIKFVLFRLLFLEHCRGRSILSEIQTREVRRVFRGRGSFKNHER